MTISTEKTSKCERPVAQIDPELRQLMSEAAPVAAQERALADSGLWALAGIARHLHRQLDPGVMAHELALRGRSAAAEDILRAAAAAQLKAKVLDQQPRQALESLPRPIILLLRDGEYVILGRRYRAHSDLHTQGMQTCRRTHDEIAAQWSGQAILVEAESDPGANHGANAEQKPFGLSWFLTALGRYRKPLGQILLASLFVQILALVTPLVLQTVIDKVLVHNAVSTLYLVAFALLVLGLFEVLLLYLRGYAISHTAMRLDVEVTSRVIAHLLRLPLSYFETNAAGQITARIRETDTIRAFLTDHGLTAIMDILFVVVFILVLAAYSVPLMLLVVLSIPFYLLIVLLIRPRLYEKMRRRFACNADSQQLLTESIVCAHTIKAMAIEPSIQDEWGRRRAAFGRTAFETSVLGSSGFLATQYLSKVVTAFILFFGANAVMGGELSVGELVAFNMIAGQVMGPILRLSQLWQDFQQVQISIARLGDIMETRTEVRPDRLTDLPPVRGAIALRDVSFRYTADGPEVLQDVCLDVPEGQVIGIVGPSGCGKSTLTKLIQGMYAPQRGGILIDGVDLAGTHPSWAREQMGVVLQETLLFNRTVFDNIALAVPFASTEQVVAAARLAGAHEFITKLPKGYETRIEERGANLSGGQRQRIAIARALIGNPRILILDEATSAVDYESERLIQANLRKIVQGRTVIIVAHRLSTVRHCDRIVALVDGRIVEDGSHDELLGRHSSVYRQLWTMQSSLAAT